MDWNNALQGIGKIAQGAFFATPAGQGMLSMERHNQRREQNSLAQDLAVLKTIQKPEDRLTAFNELAKKYPQLRQLQGKFTKAAFEKQAKAKDPMVKAGELALAGKRLEDFGAIEAADAVLGKVNEIVGVQGQIEQKAKTKENETALADYFAAGVEQLKDEQGKGFTSSPKQIEKLGKSFAKQAESLGVDAKNAELLFGNLYDEEVGKAGVFRNDVLPKRKVLDNQDYFNYELPAGSETKTQAVEAPKTSIEDLFQAATESLPFENIPKTFEQIGAKTPDQQATLQEMQKAIPDVDLKSEYEADPENMERLMNLWKQKKVNSKNLRDFFSKLQQGAKQTLGIG